MKRKDILKLIPNHISVTTRHQIADTCQKYRLKLCRFMLNI